MHPGQTIAAVCTPAGHAPAAALRLSGPHTLDTLASLGIGETRPGAHAVRLALGERTFPAGLVLWRGPRSYTGEDAAELVVPGGPALLSAVRDMVLRHTQVVPAGPGEFSALAFLAGRLSLEQAEGVAAGIAAETAAELAAARRLLSGERSSAADAAADELATLLALVEAGIDFADEEDVVAIEPGELARRLGALTERLAPHVRTGASPAGQPPTVVLLGPPNAGKSTLFNALLGRRRSVESPVAGTTRDLIREDVDLPRPVGGPVRVTLIDAPGLESADAEELARVAGEADCLLVCEPSGDFAPWTPAGVRTPSVCARTKADRSGGEPAHAVAVCALTGAGLDALRGAVVRTVASLAPSAGEALGARHTRAVERTLAHLRSASGLAPAVREQPELVAGALRAALDELGVLAGRIHPDDVLGRIFGSFCIGK